MYAEWKFNALALELLKSLYVDDFVSGAKDVNNAFCLSKEIKLCLKSGSGTATQQVFCNPWNKIQPSFGDFAINSKECVQEEDESFSKSVFTQGTAKEQKVLGMLWNPKQDELIHDFTRILEGVDVQPATRRLILSTATRFFDPLRLISPVILPFKIMFQKLCKAQRDWDEFVDTELNQEWLSTLSDLWLAGRASFKRCYAEGFRWEWSEIAPTSLFCRCVGKGVRSCRLHESRIWVKSRMWDCGVINPSSSVW